MVVTIKRWGSSPFGTFGELAVGGFRCFTVERPWLNNEPWVSCIPNGEYEMTPTRYHRRNINTWELGPVPGRTRILIHPGNTWTDVRGCVAVGSTLGYISGSWAVLNSRQEFGNPMKALPWTPHTIIISGPTVDFAARGI